MPMQNQMKGNLNNDIFSQNTISVYATRKQLS